MKTSALPLLVTGSVLLAGPAAAVTFVNGSFENITSSYVDSPTSDLDINAAADGWTIASLSPDWGWGEGPAGRWNTNWGDYFTLGAANGTGFREAVSQSVSGFTVGQSYELTFSQANGLFYSDSGGYEGVGVSGGWEVLLNGVTLILADSANGNLSADPDHTSDWLTRVEEFTATAETIEFEFRAYLNPQQPAQLITFQFLDNVGVVLVPEPGVGCLAVLGGGLLGWRRTRNP